MDVRLRAELSRREISFWSTVILCSLFSIRILLSCYHLLLVLKRDKSTSKHILFKSKSTGWVGNRVKNLDLRTGTNKNEV